VNVSVISKSNYEYSDCFMFTRKNIHPFSFHYNQYLRVIKIENRDLTVRDHWTIRLEEFLYRIVIVLPNGCRPKILSRKKNLNLI